MGDTKDLQEAIEARMVALGFTQTEDVFDFDAVPGSVVDQAFRIETEPIANPYFSFNIANTKERISIWVCYKTHRKRRTVQKTAKDDRETIEVDLINHASISGLSTDPLLTMDAEATQEKFLEHWLISKLAFTADIIRDIS